MKCIILLCFCVALPGRSTTNNVHPAIQKKLQEQLRNMPWKWRLIGWDTEYKQPVSFNVKVVSTYKVNGMIINEKDIFFYHQVKYRDCAAILKKNPSTKEMDGVYTIYPDLKTKKHVYCDMTTEGGGWTVGNPEESLLDGSTDFSKDWRGYKFGFGDPKRNYWIGNDALHLLTKSGNQVLRVDLQRFNRQKAYAKYTKFSVGNENSKYTLAVSGYKGTAGDSLSYHNGMKFSTKDQDHDYNGRNCAALCKAGWWYNSCYHSNLNGQYANSAVVDSAYLTWYHWKKKYEALRRTSMMIRPS